jgi:TM2 domain-containing membrane protein YozV
MAGIFQWLPMLEGDEMVFVQGIVKDMSESQIQQFATVYAARRKDPQTILLTALVGFLGVAGVHRFLLGHIGMGILYLLTAGLCFIGTIIDLVNHRSLAFEVNARTAQEVAMMVRAST